jgi:hypothetical protein
LSEFDKEGFLSTEIGGLTKRCHTHYKEWFNLYESINRYCWGLTSRLKFHSDNRQEYFTLALFLRMLSVFEGSYVLIERGMVSETKILLRTLMETLFSLCAVAKDKDAAERFYQGHNYLKYKALKKMLESHSPAIIPNEIDHSKRLAELKNLAQTKKSKPLSVEDWATKAGLHDFYASAYIYFSWTAHSNVMEIGQLLQGESDDSVRKIVLSPNFEEVYRYLMTGIECIVIALGSINELFHLKENDRIEEYDRSYKELYKKSVN